MRFSINVTFDNEIGGVTVAIDELPLYGEGKTPDEALSDLVDTVVEFCKVYIEDIDCYKGSFTPLQQALMGKLLRCHGDKRHIRAELLGLS